MRSLVWAMLSLLTISLGGAMALPAYTLDLQATARSPLPTWVDALNRTESAFGPGSLEIPLRAPEGVTHLAVTVVFEERTGETLEASWRANGDPVPFVLAANLLEGLNDVSNQRTFLVERALVDAGGTLVLSSSQPAVSPSKVVLNWLEAEFVLTNDRDSLPALLMASGQQLSPAGLTGAAFEAAPDKAGAVVVDASLVETTESFDDVLEVELTLTESVRAARLSASLLGLPLSAGVSIYINGVYAGEAQLQMPSLDDPGYDLTTEVPTYAGWRKAELTVAGNLLKSGVNRITFAPSTTDPNLELVDPSYLRNARLQVIYTLSNSTP